VENNTGNQLFALFSSLLIGEVDELVDVLALFNAVLVEVVLEVFSQLLHGCHISEQDGLGHSLFDVLDLSLGKLSTQEVVVVVVEQLQRSGGVEILLDVLFAVHLADG